MMANTVTFPQWKLTYPKIKTAHIILIVVILLIVIITTAFFLSVDSCGLKHIEIVSDLDLYNQNLDPEFCADLLEKIYSFNDSCKPTVEIIDCG